MTESLLLLPLAYQNVIALEQKHWLRRERASLAIPRKSNSAVSEINEIQLEALIPRFYERVRDDTLIGPVFDAAITDWDHHLEKLVAFWSSVMLTSGRFKGNPMGAHLKHLGVITPAMFDRWLVVWAEVTGELLPPAAAAALQAKAARIAESLKLGMYFRIAPVSGTPAAPHQFPERPE